MQLFELVLHHRARELIQRLLQTPDAVDVLFQKPAVLLDLRLYIFHAADVVDASKQAAVGSARHREGEHSVAGVVEI